MQDHKDIEPALKRGIEATRDGKKGGFKMRTLSFTVLMAFVFLAVETYANELLKAELPVCKEGEFWQFRGKESALGGRSSSVSLNGEWEIICSGDKLQTFSLDGDKKVEVDLSNIHEPITLTDLIGAGQGKRKLLQFPLMVDPKVDPKKVTWEITYLGRGKGARRDAYRTAYNTLMGVEEVIVPAGTFKAIKIERVVRAGGNGRTASYFYSRETRSIISYRDDGGPSGEIELQLTKHGIRAPGTAQR